MSDLSFLGKKNGKGENKSNIGALQSTRISPSSFRKFREEKTKIRGPEVTTKSLYDKFRFPLCCAKRGYAKQDISYIDIRAKHIVGILRFTGESEAF